MENENPCAYQPFGQEVLQAASWSSDHGRWLGALKASAAMPSTHEIGVEGEWHARNHEARQGY